ncbi:MAG: serine hydrolase domain-containing protein [Myxococcota bacterium]
MRALILLVLALLVSGCAAGPTPWDGPRLADPRDALTVEDLLGGPLPPVLDTSYLARPAWAEGDGEPLAGVMDLDGGELELDFARTRSRYPGEDRFPATSIALASDGGRLVTRAVGERDPDSLWDVRVGTGAVWREAGDGGWNRGSFPIDLVDGVFNQVRNCVATFVYREGEASRAFVQCGQETADALDDQIGDLHGFVPVDAGLAPLWDAEAMVEAQRVSQASRIPVHPLSEWDRDGELAALFDRGRLTWAPTSVGAVYDGGVLYVHPAMTRQGPHPYPDEMHHGVFSVTKSLAGALAMFAFAARYGDGIFEARITDHVPALADRPEWQGVTFAHALDMATGTWGGEDAGLLFEPLVLAGSADEALANIAALGDAPEGAGEAFRYATTNTFVLSSALQHYVEEREGPGVRYWDLVRAEVLEPIGVYDLDLLTTHDDRPEDRIPLLGFGARPTLDQAARIARLLTNEGEHDGRQLLHRGRVREALGRTGWDGLRVDGRLRYRHSFWSRTVRTGGCRTEVSFMQGHGGNHVLLLESGVVVFRFMDELDDDPAALARAAERVKPSC